MDRITALVNHEGMAYRPKNPPNRIRELRLRADVSLEKIAKGIGPTSLQQIYKLENQVNPLTHGWMVDIAKVLQVRPSALIDPAVEFLPDTEGESHLTDQLNRRRAMFVLWDLLDVPEQDSLLLAAKAFAQARGRTAA
jgi:transcriptional regulator with XRE-family HTH domain